MIVLVRGDADYWEWDTVCMVLDLIGVDEIVYEDGPGASAEAHYWAARRGVVRGYTQFVHLEVTFSKTGIEVK
jgi:hypothetical protein